MRAIDGSLLKAQDAARAAGNTLAASKAAAIIYLRPLPGMTANININGAIIGTDTTLYASRAIRNNISRGLGFTTRRTSLE